MQATPTSTAAPRVSVRRAAVTTAIAAVYAASGELGYVLVVPVVQAAAVAPMSASALAACLLWGLGCWPCVFAAALAVALWSGLPRGPFSFEQFVIAISVAAAATLHAVCGAWLLRVLTGLRLPLLAARGEGHNASGHEPAHELEQARALLEQANSTKQLFLGNMSHELRTPLHAVLSYAQLGRDASSANEQREYFERITERGQALLDLLSNLLDLTRLESGSMRMEFAQHDLTTLVRDVLRQMEPEFRAKQLRSEYKRTPDCESGRAIVDPVRVGQLLQNVFANAIRVSPVGGLITVQLSRTTLPRAAQQAGSAGCAAIEIAISDEGMGIPESELELIFDKFIESSKTRSNAGGIGVGLAICREIVVLHDGAIWASNNRAVGATVRIALPQTRGVVEGGTAIRTEHVEERGAA